MVSLSEIATTHWAGLYFVCTHSSPLATMHSPTRDIIFCQCHADPDMGVLHSHVIYSCQCTCTCPMQVFCVYTHVYMKCMHCAFIYMTFYHLFSLVPQVRTHTHCQQLMHTIHSKIQPYRLDYFSEESEKKTKQKKT